MDKQTAQKLLVFVNDETCYSAFQKYLQEEQDKVLIRMMSAEDTNLLIKCQGSFKAFESMKSLKQKVLNHE